jgi:hypothetical protein
MPTQTKNSESRAIEIGQKSEVHLEVPELLLFLIFSRDTSSLFSENNIVIGWCCTRFRNTNMVRQALLFKMTCKVRDEHTYVLRQEGCPRNSICCNKTPQRRIFYSGEKVKELWRSVLEVRSFL